MIRGKEREPLAEQEITITTLEPRSTGATRDGRIFVSKEVRNMVKRLENASADK